MNFIFDLLHFFLPQRTRWIHHNGTLYMERIHLLRWSRLSINLHRIHQSDRERALHSHPWDWSVSLVLAGGYEEDNLGGGRVRRPGSVAAWTWRYVHRVSRLLGPTSMSLFISGPVRPDRGWGFLVDGEIVPWREYFRREGITTDATE